MTRNIAQGGSQSSGAIQVGRALLSGLFRRGRCGRILRVRYSGTGGRVSCHVRNGATDQQGWVGCSSLVGLTSEPAIVRQAIAFQQLPRVTGIPSNFRKN